MEGPPTEKEEKRKKVRKKRVGGAQMHCKSINLFSFAFTLHLVFFQSEYCISTKK